MATIGRAGAWLLAVAATLLAVRAAPGTPGLLWQVPLPAEAGYLASDGLLLLLPMMDETWNATLRALSLADGEADWDCPLHENVTDASTLSNVVASVDLAAVSLGSTLFGVSLGTGEVEWASPVLEWLGEPSNASVRLSAVDDVLLAVTDSGMVAAVELSGPQAGELLWSGSSLLPEAIQTHAGLALLPRDTQIQAVSLADGGAVFTLGLLSPPTKLLMDGETGTLLSLLEDGTLLAHDLDAASANAQEGGQQEQQRTLRWALSLPQGSSIAAGSGLVLHWAPLYGGGVSLVARSAADGSRQWSAQLGSQASNISLALHGGLVYAAAEQPSPAAAAAGSDGVGDASALAPQATVPTLVVLNASTGQGVWLLEWPELLIPSPIAVADPAQAGDSPIVLTACAAGDGTEGAADAVCAFSATAVQPPPPEPSPSPSPVEEPLSLLPSPIAPAPSPEPAPAPEPEEDPVENDSTKTKASGSEGQDGEGATNAAQTTVRIAAAVPLVLLLASVAVLL